ncbi:copine-8-like [Planococcus citri]|uniref:copine-8-like n=1 Tax=Planococcus citri TaxID=170843 RepID=UPI0031F8A0BD
MSTFTPGTSANPTSEVELSISCRNLLDCDVFSKSDPMCVVFYKSPEVPDWREICRTEVIDNNLNPNFSKKAILTYHFEVLQELKFSVYDVDNNSSNLNDHDFLGSCTTTLGQLVSASKLTLPLKGGKEINKGQLTVHVEELSSCRDEIVLEFKGWGLQRDDWCGWFLSFFRSSNAFLEFAKSGEEGDYRVVHRSEVVRWSTSPRWKRFSIPLRSLCGGDLDRDIKIACFDYNNNGSHTLIGEFNVTVNQLSKGVCSENDFECYQVDTKKRNPTTKTNGRVTLEYYEMRKVHTFLDYITGGTQLNCTFAIDFTSSNGDPHLPSSLHYISGGQPNQYQQALKAVGEIIQDYDSDKMYPVLGFGARLPPDGRISHEFFVNMHPTNPFCTGIDGVLDAYQTCIRSVQLYGPTNFSPVIHHVAKFAQTYQDGSQYFILLIITDGVITDMQQTKKAIVEASKLPMSIIIVGVGYADFSAMDELDGDTVPVSFNGQNVARDIVQFVPFRNFQHFENPILARAALAKEVLAEIPEQIVDYMKTRRIEPGSFKKQ